MGVSQIIPDVTDSSMAGAPDSRPNISGLLGELDVPVTPSKPTGAQPTARPTAQPTATQPEDVPGADGWTPAERSYLKEMMRRNMEAEQDAQNAREFLEHHRQDYLPTEANYRVLTQIIAQGTGEPVLHFDPEQFERAFRAAIAHDLLELPPAQSISEAQLQDRHIAVVKQAFADENKPQPTARPTVRTAMFESSAPVPAPNSQPSNEQVAADLSKMGIEEARRYMEKLMYQTRTANAGY